MAWEQAYEELALRREQARGMGGPEGVEKQHGRGKLTVRERIDALLDPGTFREFGTLAGKARYTADGDLIQLQPANSVIGNGRIDGGKVMVAGDDYTIAAGSSESSVADKWVYAERMAHQLRMPLVRLVDTAGGSVRLLEQQQATKIPGYSTWPVIPLLSTVPVVGVALGACAGLGAVKVSASHFSVMVEGISQIFAAGPPVVRQGLGLTLHKDELGGARIAARGGTVSNVAKTEQEAFQQIRRFLSFLPRNVWQAPPVIACEDDPARADPQLNEAIPENRRKPYMVRDILKRLFDHGDLFEMSRAYGGSTLTCFARLNGYPVGVMANDPMVSGGAMTHQSAAKMERFVDLCDTFHLPIVNFVDQPGLMIGPDAEAAGTVPLVYRAAGAIEQAAVPWVSIVIRRAFGVGGGLHGPKYGETGQSLNHRFAWPSAQWGSIPIEGGVAAAYRREIEAAPDPELRREELEAYYRKLASPFRTAEKFGIVDIIQPSETRALLCDWVEDAYEVARTQLGPRARPMR
ncbi:acyl-CoA carboxylase subunit beta [Achromobacter aloeverae]|uniref:Propionyl-CoA carboxylase n=1 Tax=Achromobacter aloeverae TaxID=1750518 RepID=A0A4Q1HFI0_9BURK|nr:carboxyl transferase domain-containing protein [Achromobacter aloeverae]RXN85389.1 propionyl-CoA carboxylase [Achromobacter aloeverae]